MICTCGATLLPIYGTDLAICQRCGLERTITRDHTREQADPCAEPDDVFDGSEADLVQAIREWCVANGYRVDRIGQHVAKGSGTEKGVGDLMIRRRERGVAMWQAFEAKTHGKAFTPEQRLRIENGDLLPAFCVRQVREALE